MKLDINLASQAYEDSRQFYLRWLPALAALLLLALLLGSRAALAFRDARAVDRELSAQNRHFQKLNAEKAAAEQVLARPENAGTRDRAQFLNALFRRKAFSWTQVLTDLERLMPTGVQVTSIQPTLTEDGRLQFTMEVVTESRGRAIELIRRMEEQSNRFQNARILQELTQRDNQGRYLGFEIVSTYVPDRPKESR
jgi:type IV pilus assembly protein PilN